MSLAPQRVLAVEEVLADRGLTSTEKMVMVAIICDAVLDGERLVASSTAMGRLAQRGSLSVCTVRRAVGSLERRRYLRVQRGPSAAASTYGRPITGPNHYTILRVKE